MDAASSITKLAYFAGYVATACFVIQYIPQALLNYQRKSVAGFSTTGIIVKLMGAAFLAVNAHVQGEPLPVMLYGFLNIIQHTIFLVQFATYTQQRSYLYWSLSPLIPLALYYIWPASTAYSNVVKPLTQIFSHIPQLMVTYRNRSTQGVSIVSQHLNFIGGCLGLFMYTIVPPKSALNTFVYMNSIFQAFSIYLFAIYFDGASALTREISAILNRSTVGAQKMSSSVSGEDKPEKQDV